MPKARRKRTSHGSSPTSTPSGSPLTLPVISGAGPPRAKEATKIGRVLDLRRPSFGSGSAAGSGSAYRDSASGGSKRSGAMSRSSRGSGSGAARGDSASRGSRERKPAARVVDDEDDKYSSDAFDEDDGDMDEAEAAAAAAVAEAVRRGAGSAEAKASAEDDVWPNRIAFLPSTSRARLPVIHFSPATAADLAHHYREVDARKAAAAAVAKARAGGAAVPEPAAGMSPIKKRTHVTGCTCPSCRKAARSRRHGPLRMFYKMSHSGVGIVQAVLKSHGFRPTQRDNWNSLWTSAHLKSYVFQGLNRYQKINQFPRSYEVTRKDNLARNIRRMSQVHGDKHFEFLPKSFVLPADMPEFREEWAADKGATWIVKPSASACGRGIYITQDWDVGMDDGCTVSSYVANPLLLDGYKFDLRLYVAVTSFNPLRIYVHEEGLARFATEPYDPDPKHYGNNFMHLTNYSINKKSSKFVGNKDEFVEDAGHKWSLTALRRRLRSAGIDDKTLFSQIDDLIVKTLIAMEPQVMAAVDMFVPHHSNCYELFGFDVIIDDTLTPYLLEVNFAPSLACDTPLDHHIKSLVVSELFTLAGFQPFDIAQADTMHREGRGTLVGPRDGKGGKKKKGPSGRWDVGAVAAATGVAAEDLVVPSGPRVPVSASGDLGRPVTRDREASRGSKRGSGGGSGSGGGGGGGSGSGSGSGGGGSASSVSGRRDVPHGVTPGPRGRGSVGEDDTLRDGGGGVDDDYDDDDDDRDDRDDDAESSDLDLLAGVTSSSRGRSLRRSKSHGRGGSSGVPHSAGRAKALGSSARGLGKRRTASARGRVTGGSSRRSGRSGAAAGAGDSYWSGLSSGTRNHLLADLSNDQRRAIRETEEELERRGHWRRAYPSPNSYEYLPFFDVERPLNRVVADHVFRTTQAKKLRRDEHEGGELGLGLAPLASETGAGLPFQAHHIMSRADVKKEQQRARRLAKREQRLHEKQDTTTSGKVYSV